MSSTERMLLVAPFRMRNLGLVMVTMLAAACAPAKDDDKGVVDDSGPPTIPSEDGKADGSARIVAVDVQSAHPYANNLDKLYTVPLADLPPCAYEIRLHFAMLRTEPGYDFVTVEPTGAPVQSFDGSRDDTWTAWFPTSGSAVNVRLDTDGSVTRHGFAIDKIEWNSLPLPCPNISGLECAAGEVDIGPPPPVCGCPPPPQCAPVADIQIAHVTHNGRNYLSHQATGPVALETHPGPTDARVTTEIGTIDADRLAALAVRAGDLGLLVGPGYDRAVTLPAGTAREELHIVAGGYTVLFAAAEGTHDAAITQLIADFEALFTCDTEVGTLTCHSGFSCQESTCIKDQSCVCPAIYAPVCSSSGQTMSSACSAACAGVEVAHDGECGIPGDACGSMLGLTCQDDNKCRFGTSQFTYPFPDASGSCVAPTYCDAPTDCEGLPHIAVTGQWACGGNTCAWQAGSAWKTVIGGVLETAHPYASSTSVWKELSLPTGAQALRLVTAAGFSLESGYDFLEVWTYKSGAWQRIKRYTGTTGAAATEEFPGRYHYLRFVSDSSINKAGFKVTAEYR